MLRTVYMLMPPSVLHNWLDMGYNIIHKSVIWYLTQWLAAVLHWSKPESWDGML